MSIGNSTPKRCHFWGDYTAATRQRNPSRMERLAANWMKAITVNCSLKPNLREDRPILCLFSSFCKTCRGITDSV